MSFIVTGDDGRVYANREEERRVLRIERAAPAMLAALKEVSLAWRAPRDEVLFEAVNDAIAKAEGDGA